MKMNKSKKFGITYEAFKETGLINRMNIIQLIYLFIISILY